MTFVAVLFQILMINKRNENFVSIWSVEQMVTLNMLHLLRIECSIKLVAQRYKSIKLEIQQYFWNDKY